MAPVKPLRTYATPAKRNVDVNSLFQLKKQTKFKRRRKKVLEVKELKPCDTKTKLSESSLNVTVNDTFDRLLKGEAYQPVVLKKGVKYNITDSDLSASKNYLSNISLHTSSFSPIFKKKRRRRKTVNKKKDTEPECKSDDQQGIFAQSVNSSLEVEKCNPKSVLRYINMTSNDNSKAVSELSIQQHSENVSFDVPKVCSTPLVELVPPKLLNSCNESKYLGSPIISKVIQGKNSLVKDDPKFLMVPIVHLNKKFSDCIKVVGVEKSVNISNTQYSTPVNYISTRKGRPPRTLHCVRDILKDANDESLKTLPLAVGEVSVSGSGMCQ